MNKHLSAISGLLLGVSLFAGSVNASVIDLSGSSTIGSLGASITGTDLLAPGLITVNTPFYGTNTGDYSPISGFTAFTIGALDLTNMASWNITGPSSIGTYVVSELSIVFQNANNLNVYTRGTFSPNTLGLIGTQLGGCGTGGNTCAVTDTSLRWSFTKSGAAVSASATLNSPSVPPSIPEPATLGLFGIGLLGFAASRRRKAA